MSAPSGAAAANPDAVLKPVGPTDTTLPAAEKPAEPPAQVNDIKSTGATSTPAHAAAGKKKKPKADLGEESSSKKKKKKGIDKLNPF